VLDAVSGEVRSLVRLAPGLRAVALAINLKQQQLLVSVGGKIHSLSLADPAAPPQWTCALPGWDWTEGQTLLLSPGKKSFFFFFLKKNARVY
jgi:hypothetical protein